MFQTTNLSITEYTLEDSPFIIELLNTPSWIKYIGDRKIRTITDAETYIKDRLIKSYKENGFGFWKVSLKETGEPIGMCGFIKRDGLDDVDIGFAFLPGHEGKGYGFESASATINFARERFQIKKLVAITVHYNLSSIKLLSKLGFHFEKNIQLPGDEEELMLFSKELDNLPE